MLTAESAAAFDEITRNHVTEGLNKWPDSFREGQFIPAVEYLRAARVRTLLMRAMAKVMEQVDLYVGSGPGPRDHEPDRSPLRGLPRQLPRHQRPPRPALDHAYRPAV